MVTGLSHKQRELVVDDDVALVRGTHDRVADALAFDLLRQVRVPAVDAEQMPALGRRHFLQKIDESDQIIERRAGGM